MGSWARLANPSAVGSALLTVFLGLAASASATTVEQAEPPPEQASAPSANDLAPTSEIPWNPDRPVPSHETWEQVLNAPLTVVSIPFRLVGALTGRSLLTIQERRLVPKLQEVLSFQAPWGIGLGPADLGERTGFGGTVWIVPRPLQGILRARLEGSTRHYNRGRVELGSAAWFVSYTHDWRPQEPFFGFGMEAREADVSDFSLRTRRAELRARLRRAEPVRTEFEAWVGERRAVVRRGREPDRASLEQVFPQVADAVFDVNEDHPYAGAGLTLDARRGRPHWTHGWRLAGTAEYFGHPPGGHGLLFPGRAASPAFSRATLEALTGFSFMRDPRSIRVSARIVDTHAIRGNEPVPLHDLPVLGGAEGLSGFEPGRFRGADLVSARLGYVFPLAEHAELEFSVERGGVFDDVWQGARLDRMRDSYGISYRLRTDVAPVGAVGVDWSHEGARVRFVMGRVE